MLQDLFDVFQSLLQRVLQLLPHSPFTTVASFVEGLPWLGWLNWFFPVSEILTILGAWLVAIAGFYLWSVVARWVKLIGS